MRSNQLIDGDSLVQCQGNDACNATATTSPECVPSNTSCPCIHIDVYRQPTWFGPTIEAQFKPQGMTLSEAAKACGYDGFEWQQLVTSLPCPSPLKQDPAGSPQFAKCEAKTKTPESLTASPTVGPFPDPPPGGYDAVSIRGYNPFPFYYPVIVATTPNMPNDVNSVNHDPFAPDGIHQVPVNGGNQTLSFSDHPVDFCLPSGNPFALIKERARSCGGAFSTAPDLSFLGFTAFLRGVRNNEPQDFLATWSWTDDYNGQVGGIIITSHSDNVAEH